MMWTIAKVLVTAGLIVLISEVAKRSDKLGAIIAALPMVTVLAMVWMYVEQQPAEKIAAHAKYTFWYVLPTLPMFVLFPALMARLGFWGALGASVAITAACFVATAWVARAWGIELL